MYAGTQFEWIDLSDIRTSRNVVQEDRPLFIIASSTEKGTEDIVTIFGEDYEKMFGKNIFSKHGQPAVEAKRIIDAGGALLFKRLVADDAYLANLILIQKIRADEIEKTDADGNPLYIDQTTGEETTDSTSGVKATTTQVTIKWETASVAKALNIQDVKIAASELYDDTGTSGWYCYPQFIICDNGRGDSIKRVKITPDYDMSRNLDFMIYRCQEWEGSIYNESKTFSADPDIIYNGQSKIMNKRMMHQLTCDVIDGVAIASIRRLASLTGYTIDELRSLDFLFGKTRRNVALPNIIIDEDSVNLNYANGLPLQNGSNGAFGNSPFGSEEWIQQAIKFWTGDFSEDIWDIDMYRIDVIPDANYPFEVKRAIEEFVSFREDAFYFRDLGLGCNTYNQIIDADRESLRSKFCASYCTTYDVIDEDTKRQINVTMMYDLMPLLVSHYKNGRFRPIAGELYNMVLTSAIPGTINFVPKITPYYNQKTMLEAARINYAAIIDDKLIVETEYTSQEKYTQLSYINNVISIQEVCKAIRKYCPKNRYQFADGSDFTKYKKDVEPIIMKYKGNFKELEFVYTVDPEMANQKIFNADLSFLFNNFVQSELFKIYAKIQY